MPEEFVCGTPLPFDVCENFRDLGGYAGCGGKRVRRGCFYRGPALGEITSAHDLALFESLNIRTVFDFRSSGERERMPDPAFSGVENIAVSAITNPDGSEVNFGFDIRDVMLGGAPALREMKSAIQGYYRRMPLNNAAYKALFAAIAQQRTPLMFHCTAGKDRTGVAAALILLALGVSHEDVMRDYLITNTCRPKSRRRIAAAIGTQLPPDAAEQMTALCASVEAESLESALNAVEAYSDIADYLEAECDFTRAQLAKMRADYLV